MKDSVRDNFCRCMGTAVTCRENYRLHLLNSRSVCNKSGVISTMISQEGLDICVLTETWLRDDSDVIRAECTPIS